MATRKTTAKKSASKAKTVESHEVTHTSSSESLKTKVTKNKFLVLIGVAAVLVILYLLRGLFVAALVNGQPIYRLSVVSQLEKQSGGQVLDAMVNEAIIRNELKKQNIIVSQEEINTEVKKIETLLSSQKQNLDEALKQRGMTRQELENQITLNKGVEKLLGKDVAVTDAEIAAFIEQNKTFLPAASSEADLKAKAKEQLIQQKVSEKYQKWVEDAKKNANVMYFVDYQLPQ